MKKALSVITALLLLSSTLCSCFAAESDSRSVKSSIVSEAPVSQYVVRGDIIKENYALSREAATEGIVLLENDGALPLAKSDSVTLFGIGSKRLIKGGSGSGLIYTKYFASLIDGMSNAEKAGLITLNAGLNEAYEAHYAAWLEEYKDLSDIARESKEISELALTDEQVAEARAASNTAIYTISRVSGEGGDRNAVKGDYYISDVEAANLAKINAAGFDKFIVILNAGTAVDTSFINDYQNIDALVFAWLPGLEGGNALADILCGEVNPSGKLVDTLAKSFDDYPSSKSFYESNAYVNYSEDIYVGYRYFETFDPEYEKVNYCFGYGMSYTDFELSGDSVTVDGENVKVSVNVKNTGKVAGKEVVQVYYAAPQGVLGNPSKELAGYAKTSLLAPGKTETVTVTFPINDMASFDDLGKTGHKAAYVLEEGDYSIYIGDSVRNAGERGIKGKYTQEELAVTEQLTSRMTPKSLRTRLTADGTYESLNVQETGEDGSYKLNLSDGSAIIEAEDYHRASDGIESTVVPELDNLKYVAGLTTGKYLEYDVSVTEESELGISLSVSNSAASVTAPFVICVNGKALRSSPDIAKTVTSGTSPVFKDFSFSSCVFAKGKNTVRIESQSDGAGVLCLDSFTIKTANERQRIVGTGTNTVEAESATVRYDNGDTSLPISDEAAFGEILVAKISKAGKYLEYELYCEEEGTYEMLFAYAATTNYTTPLDVIVNEVNQNVSYSMPKTSPEGTSPSNNSSAYYNTSAWMSTPFRIKLPQGFVTMRLLANGGCPNLNKFTLTKVFELPDGYSLISGSDATAVEAEDYSVANSDAEGLNKIAAFTKNGEIILNYLSSDNGGRYLEYKLYFEKADTYNVTINCAASTNAEAPYTFYANGELLDVGAYTIAKTSPVGASADDDIYHTYKDAVTLPMTFPKGEVTFKVLCGKGQIPNLNRFTFAPQTADTPTDDDTVPDGYTEVATDGVMTIEAETYSRFSENLNFKKMTEGASVGELIGENIHGGDWLEYDLWFKEGGTYIFNMNYAATKAYVDPFVFSANGNEITHLPYSVAKTSTGTSVYETYFVFTDMTEGVKLTFPKGKVTFRITGGGETGKSVPNLNKFTLEKTIDIPDGYTLLSPNKTTVVEAENYDDVNNEPYSAQGNIVATTNNEVGATFLEYLTSDDGGRWLEYNLYTATAGKYAFTLNYASTNTPTNPFSFLANGTALEFSDYTLSKTSIDGGTTAVEIYFQFKDSSPIELTLPRGKVAFRIVCGKGQMPNLNSMSFTLTEAIESPEPTEPTEPEPEEPEKDPTLEPGYAEDTSRLISYIDVMNGKETMDDFLAQLTNLDLARLAGGHPPLTGSSSSMGRLEKYDIPGVSTSDGGAGLRVTAEYGATCWPCSTLLACTWNEELIERVGEGVGREAAEIRLDCWLAPGMNIHRNPLCGRNFEYFSEDPLITGRCAARITLGAKKYGLHTVAKHYAVNNKETNRSNSDSRVSERALREIYLKGFEILVKTADPRYIMTSYNLINGVEAAESYDLCTGFLREEWGFNGIVMTDWGNNSNHAKEIKAGNNIKKQTGDLNGLLRAVKNGNITRAELKENARVVLETLTDSMSARIAANPAKVTRDGETLIRAIDFSFINDDHLGKVMTSFAKSGFSYKVGDYYEGSSWSPWVIYYSDGSVGFELGNVISSDNAVFDDPDLFVGFTVDAAEDGLYSIAVYTSKDSAMISVDGGDFTRVATAYAEKPATFRKTESLTVNLSKGQHSIRVRNTAFGYLAVSPYYGELPESIDCKNFTGCNSEWGLTYSTVGSEKGDYTHIVPDLTEDVANRRTDHWNLAIDETVYKYLVFCYRTNYTGNVLAKALLSGNPDSDNNSYYFTPDKTDEWTTSVIELKGTTAFRQMHFSPFGAESQNVSEDLYFDLLHFGFFKTKEDAAKFCKGHEAKPVTGKVLLSRDSDVKLYDDVVAKYASSAVVSLSKDSKTICAVSERDSSVLDYNGSASFIFGFDVPDGEYTLTVKKPGYVTYTDTVTVKDGACDLGTIALLPGDITDSTSSLYGDGVVDVDDFIRVIRAFSPEATAKFKMFTDIDEDGSVTISDLALIKTSFGKTMA